MTYSRKQLITEFEKQRKIKYLFFWGHTPNKDGSIGKSCFSQWWVAPFEVEGITYKTAEHWMMAEKARLFDNDDMVDEIIKCKTPAEAKKWGRKVTGFIPEEWDNTKYEIVKKGNLYKFLQNDDLKDFLIRTNDRVLVEASPVDPIWGIGLASDHKNVENPNLWKGENLLGFALMEVRDQLKTNTLDIGQ